MNNVTFGKFEMSSYADALIVVDSQVGKLYGIEGDNVAALPAGESAKCFECVERLCRLFLSKQLGQGSLVVAVGGGSTGDVVGLACSVYKRGCVRLLHVPTTLLAMVDSSIGGKTAIDVDGVKNAVGSYFFADTLIDASFLATLNEATLAESYGEVFKYRMLSAEVDAACQNAAEAQVIESCVRYKQQVCARDPFCKGERNKLNFGHTIGHAMELQLGISHGLAVANGLYHETVLAQRLGLCSEQYAQLWCGRLKERFELFPLSRAVLCLALQDKKNSGRNSICFVLPPRFEQVNVTLEQTLEALL